MRKFEKKFIKAIVADAIEILFKQAEQNFESHPERSRRYLKMIWDLVKKHNFRLSRKQKLRFCKKCFNLWIPKTTVTISFDKKENMFEFVCKNCGYKKRFK